MRGIEYARMPIWLKAIFQGNQELKQGNYDEAIRLTTKALKLVPSSSEAALLLLKKGKEAKAGVLVKKAEAEIAKHAYDSAIAHAQLAIQLQPGNDKAQGLLLDAKIKKADTFVQKAAYAYNDGDCRGAYEWIEQA